MRKKRIVFFITCGVLCILAALSMTIYNIWDEHRAEESAQSGLQLLQAAIAAQGDEGDTPPAEAPETGTQDVLEPQLPEPQLSMNSLFLEGQSYVGVLEIPALGLTLPVLEHCTDSLLRLSPCLYEGNLYDGMIIAGHNYRSHFASLSRLVVGDEIRFTDVDGTVWRYEVSTTEVIDGQDVEAMEAGNWDLTLFTCTFDRSERYTIRCTMQVF